MLGCLVFTLLEDPPADLVAYELDDFWLKNAKKIKNNNKKNTSLYSPTKLNGRYCYYKAHCAM